MDTYGRDRALSSSQKLSAAAVLARAFQNYPVFAAAIPDEDRRRAVLPRLFHGTLQYTLLYGRVDITPNLEGVACWLPPGQTHVTYSRGLRSGLLIAALRLGWSAYRRFLATVMTGEKLRARFAAGPHWYLWAVGVEPERKGSGFGSAVLQPVLSAASTAGQTCYLETHVAGNLAFYQKHGFRVVGEEIVQPLGVHIWGMRREPERP